MSRIQGARAALGLLLLLATSVLLAQPQVPEQQPPQEGVTPEQAEEPKPTKEVPSPAPPGPQAAPSPHCSPDAEELIQTLQSSSSGQLPAALLNLLIPAAQRRLEETAKCLSAQSLEQGPLEPLRIAIEKAAQFCEAMRRLEALRASANLPTVEPRDWPSADLCARCPIILAHSRALLDPNLMPGRPWGERESPKLGEALEAMRASAEQTSRLCRAIRDLQSEDLPQALVRARYYQWTATGQQLLQLSTAVRSWTLKSLCP